MRRLLTARLIGNMRRDKNMWDGALGFVLVRGAGDAFTTVDEIPGRGRSAAARGGLPDLSRRTERLSRLCSCRVLHAAPGSCQSRQDWLKLFPDRQIRLSDDDRKIVRQS